MALGMAAGAGLAGDSGGFSRRPDMPDVVPVMVYPDGGWIGRIVNKEGFIATVLPMWHRGSDHWTEPRRPPVDWIPQEWSDLNLVFVYVCADGLAQGVIYVNYRKKIEHISDLGGPGMGPIIGRARARLLGFIYGFLLSESYNPIMDQKRTKLESPIAVADSTFKRKKTQSGLKIRQLLKEGYFPLYELTEAAESLAKSKNLRPWGWEALRFQHNLHSGILRFSSSEWFRAPRGVVQIGVALHHAVALKPPSSRVWEEFWKNYDLVLTPAQQQAFKAREAAGKLPPLWTLYLFRNGGSSDDHWRPLAFLGASDIGPFEAMVAANMFTSESQLEGWLNAHADFTGLIHPGFEVYALLDEPSPLTADTPVFIVWAEGQDDPIW